MRHWQVNRHFLKVLKVVAWIAATLFVLLYLLPLGLFRIPAVQKEAASRVAGLLTEIFDSPVQLERVELMSWTNIEAHRVIVLDTAGRRMLTADRLIGGISLSDLITQQEVRITSARLFEADLRLIRDPKTGKPVSAPPAPAVPAEPVVDDIRLAAFEAMAAQEARLMAQGERLSAVEAALKGGEGK